MFSSHTQAVTHPSINRDQRRVTTLIEAMLLLMWNDVFSLTSGK